MNLEPSKTPPRPQQENIHAKTMASLRLLNEALQGLLDNATLLKTLNNVPERPRDNVYTGERSKSRRLTPEREQQLASSFAYLSANAKDVHKVRAASVEENPKEGGITIRVATNSGDLSNIKEGLEKIVSAVNAARDKNTRTYTSLSP